MPKLMNIVMKIITYPENTKNNIGTTCKKYYDDLNYNEKTPKKIYIKKNVSKEEYENLIQIIQFFLDFIKRFIFLIQLSHSGSLCKVWFTSTTSTQIFTNCFYNITHF